MKLTFEGDWWEVEQSVRSVGEALGGRHERTQAGMVIPRDEINVKMDRPVIKWIYL